MNKIPLLFLSLLFPLSGISQTPFAMHIDSIAGVWIASKFKHSFDTTLSMVKSRNAIADITPVGFRINTAEITDSVISIGYGVLHSHVVHPEVSRYCVQAGDTIYEQGSFRINLGKTDSAGWYQIPDLFSLYALPSVCQLFINYHQNTTITLLRKATASNPEIRVQYERIQPHFSKEYPYPNPRDLYIRSKTLVGTYTLLDYQGKIVSTHFQIPSNGICTGFADWEGKKIEFITDVYCGGPPAWDKVILYNPERVSKLEGSLYIYKKIGDSIQLIANIRRDDLSKKKVLFTLEKTL